MVVEKLKQALSAFLTESEIVADEQPFLIDQRKRYVGRADIIVQPESVEKIQALMQFCFANKIAVTPQGGNTGLCGAGRTGWRDIA